MPERTAPQGDTTDNGARSVPYRGGGFRPVRVRGVGIATFVVLIALV